MTSIEDYAVSSSSPITQLPDSRARKTYINTHTYNQAKMVEKERKRCAIYR